ncbi:MAG: hypothetical protein ACLTMR_13530, partial [Faecalibacillus sp.]
LAFGGSVNVPQITVDDKGRSTAIVNRAIKLPAAPTTVSGNAGSATKLATARTIDGVSFNGTANIIHYGTCSTAAATVAKTVSCTGFTLVTGAEITIRFTVTNTAASPTLNVNNTGAKAIVYRNAAISAGYLAANRVYKFVYDGTNYELIGDVNTDANNKVTQTVTTTDSTYPILTSATANRTATATEAARFASAVTINPSKQAIAAKTINSSLVSTTYLAGNQGTAIINSTGSSGGYVALIKYPSTNGVFCLSGYQTKLQVHYTVDSTIEAGTNSTTKQATLLDESGNTTFPGTVTATTFKGALSGNASTATTATKLGTATVGGTAKPIYLNAGAPTALSATVGSTSKPVYLNAGTVTALSTTVGGASKPIYS